MELSRLDTEQRNPRTSHIDTLPTLDMVTLINEEDHRCADAVQAVLPEIARSIDVIYEVAKEHGKLTALTEIGYRSLETENGYFEGLAPMDNNVAW